MTRPIKVLIIEDDELDRMIVKRAINSSGMNVEMSFADDVDTGKEATTGVIYDCIFLDYNLPGGTGLELLKEHKPSLIISDQRMPNMAGVDFLARRPQSPDRPGRA